MKVIIIAAIIITIIFLIIYFSGGKIKELNNVNNHSNYNDRIPKTVMQTIKYKQVPERLRNYIDLIIKENPEFNREIYDDYDIKEFIKNDEKLLNTFNNIKIGVVKADFFRLVWLLKKGGIYTDIDMIALKPFKKLEDTDMLILFDNEKEELVFHFIASGKDNPIIKNTLNECMKNINNDEYLKDHGSNNTGFISKICGPEVFTKIFKDYYNIEKFKEEEIIKDGLKIRLIDLKNYEDILKHKYIGWSYYVDTYRINQGYWGIEYDNVKHIIDNY